MIYKHLSELIRSAGNMVDTINLCEDEDAQQNSSTLHDNQLYRSPQPSKPISIQPTVQNPGKVELDRLKSDSSTFPSFHPDSGAVQHRAFPEAFYIEFTTTMEHTFPWQTFAARHNVSYTDLRHMFFVLVILPLSDPDDNSKRLKVAEGARKRFREWRQAWEETVANVMVQDPEFEDVEEQEGPLIHVRAEGKFHLSSKKRRLSREGDRTRDQ